MTSTNFYIRIKENNENNMAAQVFWAVFHFSWWLSQIGPTADLNRAAIQRMILACLICNLGSDLKGPCKIYPIFFRVAKEPEMF